MTGEQGLEAISYEEAARRAAGWAASNKLDEALAATNPVRAIADADIEGSFPDCIDEDMLRRAGLCNGVDRIIGSHLRRDGVVRVGPLIQALPRLGDPDWVAEALR